MQHTLPTGRPRQLSVQSHLRSVAVKGFVYQFEPRYGFQFVRLVTQ